MTNHVHRIVIPGRADWLARGIGRAHNAFSRWMNIRRYQTRHFLQARFDSSPMDRPSTWRALLYTDRNPARAGMVGRAVDYPWSSARVHARLSPCPQWLTLHPWAEAYAAVEWGEILELGFREYGQLERLREGLRSGRPQGNEAFIDELEAKPGRPLRLQKTGRPPKAKTAGIPNGADAEGDPEEPKKSQLAKVSIPWDDQRGARNSESR